MELKENTIFDEIKLPESVEEKRKLISRYNGRFAFVKDEHLPSAYTLIKLNYSGEDPQVYHTNKNRNFHFHDLEGILVEV